MKTTWAPITPWGEGYSLILAIEVCATPKVRVFSPLWSENACRLGPFWSEIGYGFRGNYGECMNVFIVSISNK